MIQFDLETPNRLGKSIFDHWCQADNTDSNTIDERIIEIMMADETPWVDNHHRSSFPEIIENTIEDYYSPNVIGTFQGFIYVHEMNFKNNLANIEETIPLSISMEPGVVENVPIGGSCSHDEINICKDLFQEFHDVFAWTYEDIPIIDPNIVVHEIKTYLDAKLVRQCLCAVHLKKDATIKAKVEKLLHVGFMYPIPLINWVSNIFPVMKK